MVAMAAVTRTIRFASVLVALALLGPACGRDDRPLPAGTAVGQPAAQRAGGEEGQPAGTAYSCVETYSAETLGRRAFAFDGTVLEVETRTDPRLPQGEDEVPWVTFEVNRWFKAGSASEVGVWIETLNVETSVGTISAEPGTRLLVAGEPRWGGAPLDDPIAWPCGFTQQWTPEVAEAWEAALSE
jgi:hypothetical protein